MSFRLHHAYKDGTMLKLFNMALNMAPGIIKCFIIHCPSAHRYYTRKHAMTTSKAVCVTIHQHVVEYVILLCLCS